MRHTSVLPPIPLGARHAPEERSKTLFSSIYHPLWDTHIARSTGIKSWGEGVSAPESEQAEARSTHHYQRETTRSLSQ